MSSQPVYRGGCLCGAIRYEAKGPAFEETICHCSICRRASGAPYVAWFTVKLDGFRVVKGTLVQYRSSASGLRGRCTGCGTQITFLGNDAPEAIDVTTASLDNPALLPPKSHSYFDDRLPFVCAEDGLPRHKGALPR